MSPKKLLCTYEILNNMTLGIEETDQYMDDFDDKTHGHNKFSMSSFQKPELPVCKLF